MYFMIRRLLVTYPSCKLVVMPLEESFVDFSITEEIYLSMYNLPYVLMNHSNLYGQPQNTPERYITIFKYAAHILTTSSLAFTLGNIYAVPVVSPIPFTEPNFTQDREMCHYKFLAQDIALLDTPIKAPNLWTDDDRNTIITDISTQTPLSQLIPSVTLLQQYTNDMLYRMKRDLALTQKSGAQSTLGL